MIARTLSFFAIILTALELVPLGAHVFEMPHKMTLPEQQYFAAQQLYRGWDLFGVVLIAAIFVNLALAVWLWRRRQRFWPALGACLALCAGLAVFLIWTQPTNAATANWTVMPSDWRALRNQWEYSHAADAALTFLALCCATLSLALARD